MRLATFLTAEQRHRLLRNGQAASNGASRDFLPVVKLVAPATGGFWLLTELHTTYPLLAFGLCFNGRGCPEVRHADLRPLIQLCEEGCLRIERDAAFVATKPLSAYAAEIQLFGRTIV